MDHLIIKNLSKKFNSLVVLDQVSLTISPGIFGLLGPNGAGKTTLMRIITTLIDPTEGSINYKDINWRKKNNVREIIGYLPQKFSIYKHIRVKEALLHLASLNMNSECG